MASRKVRKPNVEKLLMLPGGQCCELSLPSISLRANDIGGCKRMTRTAIVTFPSVHMTNLEK